MAGRLERAEACYREVLAIDPGEPDALNQLGVIELRRCKYDEALAYFDAAVGHDARNAKFHETRAIALTSMGRCAEALAAYRIACALAPDDPNLGANFLHLVDVHPDVAPEEAFAAHREWAVRHLDAIPRLPDPPRPSEPERRLRIGYVSGDFCRHAVGFFVEPLLAARDTAMFDVTCYQTSAREDELTARLRGLANAWRVVKDAPDDELARRIRADGIDILVDLSGITRENRLAVFARRPAALQMTFLGYLGTTGMQAMDYRITDAVADPPGAADAVHVERLLRIPRSFWCYVPPGDLPVPRSRPTSGRVVLGSFGRLTKVNAAVLEAWGGILARVPESELVVLDVPSEAVRGALLEPFVRRGIRAERVTTHGRVRLAEYREIVRDADLALDTFPYNGGASTCEALALGVPVVTRAGRGGFARSGASILAAAGLPDLIAESDADYVAVAAALAADRARLDALQRSLRDRLRTSPLCDANGFMRDLEAAYRRAWRECCAGA